jgi:hypothetical protein
VQFLCVNMSNFSLLLRFSSFLQKFEKFDSVIASGKKRNLAQSLFVHKLLLNRILVIVVTSSDQDFLRATLSSLTDD